MYSGLLFIVCISLYLLLTGNLAQNEKDICSNLNNRRIYIELGQKGSIVSKEFKETIAEPNQTHEQCYLELITCPTCVISIQFSFLNIGQACINGKDDTVIVGSCDFCDYVWIYESNYENVSREEFCGHYINNDDNSVLVYKSKTRAVVLGLFYKQIHQHAFTLNYISERNRQFVTVNANKSQIISTPYFPDHYPRNLNIEYMIFCSSQNNEALCKVSLTFTDFIIAKMSVIEFFDSNGQRLSVATGMMFRPQIIISTGTSLIIRFYANGASNKGFKAVAAPYLHNDNTPEINCGGLVENLGGEITMTNVIEEASQKFDCVWIIYPSRNYLHFYTHLYLKVLTFTEFDEDTELNIHEGLTSSGALLEESKASSVSEARLSQNYTSKMSIGFYIRFKGILRPESKLAIVYTAFGYNECIPGSDFLCSNNRCIPIYLQCDGFDHCGDNTDEPPTCLHQGLKRPRFSSNYFFPPADSLTDLHAAAIVFLICCFGFIFLILALIFFLLRMNKQMRRQAGTDNHFRMISDLLDADDAPCVVEDIIDDDDPPVYEFPPNYSEIINVTRRKSDEDTATATNRNSTRAGCSRCSNKVIKKRSRQTFNTRGTSTQVIPQSPPPAYSNENNNFPSTALTQGTDTLIFGQLVPDDAFRKNKVLKKGLLRSKIENAQKYFPNFSALKSSQSDSEICIGSSNITYTVNRSYSVDDL